MSMKKNIILVLLSIVLFSFPAFSLNRSIGFMTGNDCWNYGLFYNNDDLKSYSFGFNYETDNYIIRTLASGFTGRYLDDRFDFLETTFTYFFNFEEYNLKLNATAGFVLYGDLGFEFFQNKLHDLLKIKEVHLPYNKDNVSFVPVIQSRVSYFFKPYLSVFADLNARFGFDYKENLGLSLSYDIFTLDLAYSFNQQTISEVVLEKYISESAGLNYSFTVDKGQVLVKLESNPITANGMTTIIVSPLSPLNESIIEFSINRLNLSTLKGGLYSNEFAYKNFLISSRGHSIAENNKRYDNLIWNAGYRYNWKFIEGRAQLMFADYWERTPVPSSATYIDEHSYDFGLSLEVKLSYALGRYQFNALGGGYYLINKGFGFMYGFGLTLN